MKHMGHTKSTMTFKYLTDGRRWWVVEVVRSWIGESLLDIHLDVG